LTVISSNGIHSDLILPQGAVNRKGSVAMKDSSKCSRSDFFKSAGLVAGAAVVSGNKVNAAEEQSKADGVPLRRLGKTELNLPVVSLGTGPGQDPNIIKFAIAQGMTFLHTSTQYKGGVSIKNVAEAIKGQRDKAIIGLKITWEPDDDEAMDEALQTLGVDSVDIAFFNIHKASEVSDPKYKIGAERWMKMGKFKYIGLTSHSETAECLKAGLDQGFYHALMPSYSIADEEAFLPIFEQANKQGVGVILMKSGRGVQGAYEDAVPHYLATIGITTINKGAGNFQEIKKLVDASKTEPDKQAGIRLRRSATVAMSGHCLMCGACTDSCPKGLQVSDVVRCSDYYLENAEYFEMAFETYRGLSRTPSLAACGSCSACEQACGNNVPVIHHIRRAETALA
jgi:predicted aldo/keto reductase-like oxidoreductase